MALHFLNGHFADRLPTELWSQVFADLPYTEMLRCQLPQVRTIIESMLRLYETWLRAHALTNVEPSQIPLKKRKKMLLHYHRAWESLSPDGTLPPGSSFRPISTHTLARQSPPLVLESGWVVVSDFARGLTFIKLPTLSSLDGDSRCNTWSVKKQLTYSQLPPGLMTYRLDPSQDLLICLAMSDPERDPDIFALSMSTGQPHPLAEQHMFESGIEESDEVNSFQIHRDLVVLYAGANDERILQVWNWKTGDLLLTEEGFDAWGDTVTFVGDMTLLLVQEYILHLFVFTEDNLVHTCDLCLPRFCQEAGVQLWTTVSQPLSNAPEPGHAFTTDPDQSVVVINMARAVPGTDTKCSLLLAIRVAGLLEQVRVLLEHVRKHDSDAEPPTPTPFEYRVPWTQWGPQNTRFVTVPETWEAPSTFGRRCALSYYNADSVPELALFDFGLDAEKVTMAARTHELSEGWSVEVLPAPTSLDMGIWFEDVTWVDTQLPCRVRRRLLPAPPDQIIIAAMLWEDGVILKTSHRNQCDYSSMSLHAPPPPLPSAWPPLPPPPTRGGA
ncbi:hypothetical protein LXA43DRAFT_1088142 [Ganoderma leucocontextum]|nr:hypothetical protein LXA43DRAFT_1088142 [Ganoderma leucocontextum]